MPNSLVAQDTENWREVGRGVIAAIIFVVYATLAIIMIIALLSDWPGILHREPSRYGATINNHHLAVHETIPIADHKGGVFRKFLGPSEATG